MGDTLVLTVTPNPSLDLLFETERLVWDDANRMADPRRRPGGQGINVTRAVRALGGASTAVALLGGGTGRELAGLLEAEGTPLRSVAGAAATRTFVAVRETASGRSMLLNARGPERSTDEVEALRAEVDAALLALRPRWLACCGSLPAGFPPDFYAELAAAARAAGARVVVDCDGEPLRRAAAAGCDLLVPNQHEAARLAGSPVPDVEAARAAARTLRQHAPVVAVTLGARGALLAAGTACRWARPPALAAGSAVGAGDVFLAALLVALEAPAASARPVLAEELRFAVAAGTAALHSRGTELVRRQDVERLLSQVEVTA